ncbi:MAG: hypothetical protein C4340_03540, partial [Armatimonadota bacterium]
LLLGRRRTAGAMLGAAIGGTVALFPAVYFTSGMETAMAITLVCFALVAFQAERWTLCSVLLGLAFLARHDALLLVILLALLRAVREQPEERVGAGIRFLKPFVLVVVPWFVASLILYQTATPDTLAAKMAQGGTPYWPEAYYTGLTIYYTWFSAAKPVWVLLVLAVIGFIVSWRSRSGWAMGVWLFVLYQVLHLVAYSALGVPRYHWYYVGYGVGLGLMVGAALSVVKLPVGSAWL